MPKRSDTLLESNPNLLAPKVTNVPNASWVKSQEFQTSTIYNIISTSTSVLIRIQRRALNNQDFYPLLQLLMKSLWKYLWSLLLPK